jgi:hypothetical protein
MAASSFTSLVTEAPFHFGFITSEFCGVHPRATDGLSGGVEIPSLEPTTTVPTEHTLLLHFTCLHRSLDEL